MGLKNKITSWVAGVAVDDVLKSRLGVTDTQKRKRVVREVKRMIKSPRDEPVAYGGLVGVAVALFAAFGLELEGEHLAITISTVIALVSFIQRQLVSPVSKKDNQ
jgi:hypothetical protein